MSQEKKHKSFHLTDAGNWKRRLAALAIIILIPYMSIKMSSGPSISTKEEHRKTSGEQYHVNKSGRFGCADEDYFKKIVTIAAQGDQVAFKNTLVAGVSTGACTLFKEGEPVYLAKLGLATIKIRREGDATEYWTTAETIK
jgi:hypothetical protein